MKKTAQRLLSLLVALVLLASLSVPAFADDDRSSTIVSKWDAVLSAMIKLGDGTPFSGTAAVAGSMISALKARHDTNDEVSMGALCSSASSPDGLHYVSEFIGDKVYYDERYGYYALAYCKYCAQSFRYYSSDLGQDVEEHEASLPSDGISSDGSFIITTEHVLSAYFGRTNSYSFCPDSGEEDYYFENSYANLNWSGDHLSVGATPVSGNDWLLFQDVSFGFSVIAPVEGYYTVLQPDARGTLSTKKGVSYTLYPSAAHLENLPENRAFMYGYSAYSCENVFYAEGTVLSCQVNAGPGEFIDSSGSVANNNYTINSVVVHVSPVQYRVVPASGVVDVANDSDYGTNSRPGSLTTIYGDVGGQHIGSQDNRIVNETTNTIYNPVTGDTQNISSWDYSYTDRSYNVTTESGDTVTVTYGDENITINSGDTVYNIYYILSSDDIEQPAPAEHVHTWVESSKTEYCLLPGEAVYTCSECGRRYILPCEQIVAI